MGFFKHIFIIFFCGFLMHVLWLLVHSVNDIVEQE